jgi:hypothetical protein
LVKEIKEKHGDDLGIYDVFLADRFGSDKVVVCCVSKKDKQRLMPSILKEYKREMVYFTSPIWSIGTLIPELGKKIEQMRSNERSHVDGTEEYIQYKEKRDFVIDEEEKLWNSWTEMQKLKFIRQWIKKKRKNEPKYAICGDKFFA